MGGHLGSMSKNTGAGMCRAHDLEKRTGPGSLGLSLWDGESW